MPSKHLGLQGPFPCTRTDRQLVMPPGGGHRYMYVIRHMHTYVFVFLFFLLLFSFPLFLKFRSTVQLIMVAISY